MMNDEEQRLDQLLTQRQAHIPMPDIDAWLEEDQTQAYDQVLHRRVWAKRLTRWSVAAMLFVALTVGLLWNGRLGGDLASEVDASQIAKASSSVVCPSFDSTQVAASHQTDMKGPPCCGREEKRNFLADTLGNAVWQSEENVLLAIEMLEDCEETIQRGERMVRNDIIEATYRAIPQSPHAILVCNEAGDNEVIEISTVIEI